MRGIKPIAAAAILVVTLTGAQRNPASPVADVVVLNGRVYTLSWDEPDREGRPAANAPHGTNGWHPDAQAIAIRGDRIVLVGTNAQAMALRGPRTRMIDVAGATVVPGLVDAHVHIAELGASLERVNLVGVKNEADAVDRVVERARQVPKGQWIVGWGWDEGAWANQYPDMKLLSERVPDHPVLLRGLHSFAVWGNRLAFERAGIGRETRAPEGGEIRRDARGEATGILLNNASRLVTDAIPPATPAELEKRVKAGLAEMMRAGYVEVHEAGTDRDLLHALEALNERHELPMRVYVMLAQRDDAVMGEWRDRPAQASAAPGSRLVIRSVKAFYDGALGSRGAQLLEDYSDRPGHRGVGGAEYGFRADVLAAMMSHGYQIAIHSIGDRANRETLDFFARAFERDPAARAGRHRIEHAQVVSAADMPRFAKLGILASMQPGHAVEDMGWAESRLGPARIAGAYAWRSLRRAGARLVLSSDLPGSDYNIFYELHAAVTRRDRTLKPEGGWRPAECLTPEEALRGYTTWAAYAAFEENEAGILAPGRRANVTVMDLDPLVVGSRTPDALLNGTIKMTIVDGAVQ